MSVGKKGEKKARKKKKRKRKKEKRKKKAYGFKVSPLLLVVFKWHPGSKGVKERMVLFLTMVLSHGDRCYVRFSQVCFLFSRAVFAYYPYMCNFDRIFIPF